MAGETGWCNYLLGVYYPQGEFNGKPAYDGGEASIWWDGGAWVVEDSNGSQYWTSSRDTYYPWQATEWAHTQEQCGGIPTFVEQPMAPPEPTATITPTFSPLFPTSTPPPPKNYTCNGVQPIGVGTRTPDPGWLLNCSQCITPTPGYIWPTLIPEPIETGTPGPTPTATVTPGQIDFWHYNPDGSRDLVPENTMSTKPHKNYGVQGYLGPFPITIQIHEHSSITFTNSTNPYSHESLYFDFIGPSYLNSQGIDITIIEASSNLALTPGQLIHLHGSETYRVALWTDEQTDLFGSVGSSETKYFDLKYSVKFYGLATYNPSVQWNYLADYWGVGVAWFIGDKTVIWTTSEFPPEEPDQTDCSTIPLPDPFNGGGLIIDPNDPNFKLPYVSVGVGSCAQIGGWTIPLGWLQVFFNSVPSELTLPGIRFCFAPVSFGSLNIFGIGFDLDNWSLVMAGVVMFRLFKA